MTILKKVKNNKRNSHASFDKEKTKRNEKSAY